MSKYFRRVVLAGILAMGIFISSCVEEPTISPVKIPFAMMRFGNLLMNVDNIDVYIDGELKASNIAQNQFTDFMRITSVKRDVELRNSSTGEVLFSKTIDAVSYEEISFFAAAYYSDNIDSTTMGTFTYSEGTTYHLESPPEGKGQIFFFHGAGDTPTKGTTNLDIRALFTTPGDTAQTDSLLTPNTYDIAGVELTNEFLAFADLENNYSFVLDPNDYTFQFTYVNLDGNETDSLITSINITINEGTRNYVYVSGPPDNIQVASESRMPLPELSK